MRSATDNPTSAQHKPKRNHFDEFVAFLWSKRDILAAEFRNALIIKMDAALYDAYERGKKEKRNG